MNLKEIKNEHVFDKYYKTELPNGLNIYIYPKKGYNSKYVVLGTDYGSINRKFKKDNEIIDIPDGTAHFLEHKLFEDEDGDAFQKYALTGASANAYTSFDKTCYLFSCTNNFYESLKILLNFVYSPYFTKETIEKEQGIIAQEIKMYDDDPNWMVLFNLLGAMYKNHSVKINIAGSVESIATIDKEKLYECYNAFYNPSNMSLVIVGDVDQEEVIKFINENIKSNEKIDMNVETLFDEEPYEIVKEAVSQEMEVSLPLFEIGFKEKTKDNGITVEDIANTSILLEILSSKTSSMYQRLFESDLINLSFSSEYFEGPNFSCVIFSGESKDPDKVFEIIKEEINILREKGIDQETFDIAKKAVYGDAVMSLDGCMDIGNDLIDDALSGREYFSHIDSILNANLQSVLSRFEEQLDTNNASISKIVPKNQE